MGNLHVLADLERAMFAINDLNDQVLVVYDNEQEDDNSELDFAWAENYTFPGPND